MIHTTVIKNMYSSQYIIYNMYGRLSSCSHKVCMDCIHFFLLAHIRCPTHGSKMEALILVSDNQLSQDSSALDYLLDYLLESQTSSSDLLGFVSDIVQDIYLFIPHVKAIGNTRLCYCLVEVKDRPPGWCSQVPDSALSSFINSPSFPFFKNKENLKPKIQSTFVDLFNLRYDRPQEDDNFEYLLSDNEDVHYNYFWTKKYFTDSLKEQCREDMNGKMCNAFYSFNSRISHFPRVRDHFFDNLHFTEFWSCPIYAQAITDLEVVLFNPKYSVGSEKNEKNSEPKNKMRKIDDAVISK